MEFIKFVVANPGPIFIFILGGLLTLCGVIVILVETYRYIKRG